VLAFYADNELRLLTIFAWVAALPVLGFVVYLVWRTFGPKRRHRKRRSRMSRYLRE
jgi:hypothetical protein